MNGDLIINIRIIPHDIFYKDQKGLHTVKEISLYDAILGSEDIINVFGTNIKYVIPSGTQNASVLRIAGKGFPVYNQNTKGDLYIRVIVTLPTDLSEKEIELFNQLKQIRK
jgi:curved DNA-binding protein